MASEQPNVDEHGNVVVTYRQALGKEKKKEGRDRQSDDDDGLLRGEVEDYQPLHPDRLRPFTREAIEAEKREKWVSRSSPTKSDQGRRCRTFAISRPSWTSDYDRASGTCRSRSRRSSGSSCCSRTRATARPET